jgi:uncharacterized protein YjbI with pentapeptide repeats
MPYPRLTLGTQELLATDLHAHLIARAEVAGLNCDAGRGARLSLSGQDMTGLSLSRSTFSGVSFQNVSLVGASLTDVTFKECDFTGVSFRGASLTRTTFVDCQLRDVYAPDLVGETVTLLRCDLTSSTLCGARINIFVVKDSRLSDIDFSRADLTSAAFSGTNQGVFESSSCILEAVSFRYATLTGPFFDHAELSRADFHGTAFRGLSLWNTTLRRANFGRMAGIARLIISSSFIECSFGDGQTARDIAHATARHNGKTRWERVDFDLWSCSFTDCTFGPLLVSDGDLQDNTFVGCRFASVKLDRLKVMRSEFTQCSFTTIEMSSVIEPGPSVVLRDCTITYLRADSARFTSLTCESVTCGHLEIPGAKLSGGSFRDCRVTSGSLVNARIQASSVSAVTLGDAVLEGAILNGEDLLPSYP